MQSQFNNVSILTRTYGPSDARDAPTSHIFVACPMEDLAMKQESLSPKGQSAVAGNKEKAPGHIRRPLNSWLLFKNKSPRGQQVREDLGPGVNQQVFVSVMARIWRGMSDEEKQVWAKRASRAKLEHEEMYPNYKYNPKRTGKTTPKMSTSRRKSNSRRNSKSKSKVKSKSKSQTPSTPSVDSRAMSSFRFSSGFCDRSNPQGLLSPPISLASSPSSDGGSDISSLADFMGNSQVDDGMIWGAALSRSSAPYQNGNDSTQLSMGLLTPSTSPVVSCQGSSIYEDLSQNLSALNLTEYVINEQNLLFANALGLSNLIPAAAYPCVSQPSIGITPYAYYNPESSFASTSTNVIPTEGYPNSSISENIFNGLNATFEEMSNEAVAMGLYDSTLYSGSDGFQSLSGEMYGMSGSYDMSSGFGYPYTGGLDMDVNNFNSYPTSSMPISFDVMQQQYPAIDGQTEDPYIPAYPMPESALDVPFAGFTF